LRVITLNPKDRKISLAQRPEPGLTSDEDVKIKVLKVGICGTDREAVEYGNAEPPEGRDELVIGHEMIGRVVETGAKVGSLRPGDYAVLTVRRGCRECLPCSLHRSDMCKTGRFKERGIKGLDGFQAEYVTDREGFAIRVPPELGELGVLIEPLSVIEKAIEQVIRLQYARLPDTSLDPSWLCRKKCLVAGIGAIGLLSALVLALQGAELYGLDIVDAGSAKSKWLEEIGGSYIDGREIPAEKIHEAIGPMDVVIEASGVPSLGFALLDTLDYNGAYIILGVPGGDERLNVRAADLMRDMVLKNQLVIGSVNAAAGHFRMAIDDLLKATLLWKGHVSRLITHRRPCTEIKGMFDPGEDELKTVIEWA
jgi:threonine dehydrogenase-like Zn-dependent dehydrogenase